ncbi:unnamed protein product, partial [Musa textilis]
GRLRWLEVLGQLLHIPGVLHGWAGPWSFVQRDRCQVASPRLKGTSPGFVDPSTGRELYRPMVGGYDRSKSVEGR